MARNDEIRTAGRLAGDVLAGGVGIVRDVHRAIADRSFAAVGPLGRPVQALHDAISGGVYAVVRYAHAAVPRVGSAIAARRVPAGAQPLANSPRGEHALAALNGMWGDRISRRHPALSLPMTVRQGGRDVPCTADGLRAGYPAATGRLAVFVHGLCETDRWWWRSPPVRHGGGTTSYGSLLARDLGYTAVYLRYNTGHRISDNGRGLAALLGELTGNWPVPVTEIAFVGHSMGGLVVRSACHYGQADGYGWVPAVRHVACLGTPHLGAPLEKGVNAASFLLALVPETRPAAGLLNLRSVGVKDLRYGAVVEEDWQGADPDELLRDRCTEVPFLDHARYYFVGATLSRRADHPLGALAGDLFVRFPSAAGQGRTRRLPFNVEHGRHLGAKHHFDLLYDPAVYAHLRGWLATGDDRSIDGSD